MPEKDRGALNSDRTRVDRVWPWILMVGVAVAIRIVRLDHFSYWLDEILETYTIRNSWPGLWRSLHWQALHAPLDYAARKVIETFHPTDATRRLPAVAWGTGCAVALGLLLARRAGRAIGLSAGALLALAPYHVRYSQEVRPYALGLFLLCCALLFLDSCLGTGRLRDLILAYLFCLATLYALYLAGLILMITAAALLLEDRFDPDISRRTRARRLLAWSPVFLGAVILGYMPWLPVLLKAVRQRPMTTAPAWSAARVGRFVSYFGFGPGDGFPLGYSGIVFALLLVAGSLHALRAFRLRFVLVWGIAGVFVLELLEHRHPTYDSIFHWLPAGLGLTALAGIAVGRSMQSRVHIVPKAALIVLLIFIDARSLSIYFREGRPDWRPLARFLASTPPDERIFTENQYTQLCLGYFLVGPDWLVHKRSDQREIANLDGDFARLMYSWDQTRVAWLVLAAGPRSQALRSWSRSYPATSFPTAEGDGGATLLRLERAPRR